MWCNIIILMASSITLFINNTPLLHSRNTALHYFISIQRGMLNLEFNGGAVYMIVVTENRDNATSLVEEGEQYKVTGVEIDEPTVSPFMLFQNIILHALHSGDFHARACS